MEPPNRPLPTVEQFALRTKMKPNIPILIGFMVGLISASIAMVWRGDVGDLGSGLCLARALLNAAPHLYVACPPAAALPQDTLFAGLLMLPFAFAPPALTGGIWIGVTSGLLAWALTRQHEYWRLLLFITPAYLMTLWNVQAGALLCFIALFPDLLPLALYKPPQGLVIGLWRFSWKRALASVLILAVSLILWPTWLRDWLEQATSYVSVIPLLVLPVGPLLLLALRFWKDDRTRLLLLMSCIPQRGMYNALLLYLIPQTIWEMVVAILGAWIGLAVWITMHSEPLGLVVGCYLPMLLLTQPWVRRFFQRPPKE
jgi:hypothetical protein